RDALASRQREDRERAMQERRASASPPARSTAPRPAPASDRASAPATPAAPAWRLSDDPAIRLAGLAADTRWVLLCHPSEQGAAAAWLERGLEAMSASATAGRMSEELREAVRIEAREDVAAGELRLVR